MGSGYQAPPCYTIQTSTFSSTSQTPITTTVKMAMSKIRQNYHEDCEALINKQINMEFYASYVYLSMSSFFNRDDQALHGFADHFKKESNEERAHGMKLMEYQTKRDGQPEPARHPQGGRGQGRRSPVRLPRVRVPERAGGGHQGRRRPDHQDEEGWRRTRTSHH